MTVIIAGTFSALHRGHKDLFTAALSTGEKLILGLTTDSFVSSSKEYKLPGYDFRRRALEDYLRSTGIEFEIKPLGDTWGNSTTSDKYSTIVVSPESAGNARLINAERERNGLKKLKVIVVPFALGDDYFPIKSSRVLEGEITPEGKRIKPIRIVVPTSNRYKANAVREFFHTRIPGAEMSVSKEYSTPSEQPFGEDTYRYAEERARQVIGESDYAVSIESGLFRINGEEKYLDVHFCYILDRFGKSSVGTSSGLMIPPEIIAEIKKGYDEGKAYVRLYGDSSIYSAGGIAGALSGDSLKRIEFFSEAIRNAFVPRMHPEFYL